MNYIEIEKDGLKLTVTDDPSKEASPFMGGDPENPTWETYLSEYKKEYQPHVLLIRQAIEKLGWVGATGEDRANTTAFEFSDGQCWSFSWRAWGDLMQAIVNKQEGYMRYYM